MWHLVWLKRDLRAQDHDPLAWAARRGPVLPVYIVEPTLWQAPDASARQWQFVRECLVALRTELGKLGLPLIVRTGEAVETFESLHRALPISSISAHQETGNDLTFARDRRVQAWCRRRGIELREFANFGVQRGLKDRGHFTRHWEQVMGKEPIPLRVPSQPRCPIDMGSIPDSPLDALMPFPTAEAGQPGGRHFAIELLDSFLAHRGRHYSREMSSPLSAERACSRLSPHLAHGSIGMRELVQRVRIERAHLSEGVVVAGDAAWRRSLASFESRLHWHCHFIQKLESEPEIEWRNMNRGFDGLREGDFNDNRFERWRRGTTGWPMVDACMRMLIHTGWLNFRMRAMLMAISSYHLWLHWQKPAWHLARLFTDYEPGIHYPQAQMQSGVTGINIPRIYNPIKQGRDQDPQGEFVRRWLPELARVPKGLEHTPWLMSARQQRDADCILGRDYPEPILDAEQAARDARARYLAWRRKPELRDLSNAVMERHGSRKRASSRKSSGGSKKAASVQQADLFGGTDS